MLWYTVYSKHKSFAYFIKNRENSSLPHDVNFFWERLYWHGLDSFQELEKLCSFPLLGAMLSECLSLMRNANTCYRVELSQLVYSLLLRIWIRLSHKNRESYLIKFTFWIILINITHTGISKQEKKHVFTSSDSGRSNSEH